MKQIYIYISLLLFVFSCSNKEEIDINENQLAVSLQFEVETYDKFHTKANYVDEIKHLRILAFDAVSKVLIKQIVIPEGANPPTLLRLPWNKYTLVFLGNFKNVNIVENSTTLNSLLVSMDINQSYPGENIYQTPSVSFYYYKVENVQFGIVNNIPVILRPISSQLIFNYKNKPAYYNSFISDIKNVGQSLSMLGESLGPSVNVRKTKMNLSSSAPVFSDTLYLFASIGLANLRLSAIDNMNNTDILDYNFDIPIKSGNSYIIDFIFPNIPEINSIPASASSLLNSEGLRNVRISTYENK